MYCLYMAILLLLFNYFQINIHNQDSICKDSHFPVMNKTESDQSLSVYRRLKWILPYCLSPPEVCYILNSGYKWTPASVWFDRLDEPTFQNWHLEWDSKLKYQQRGEYKLLTLTIVVGKIKLDEEVVHISNPYCPSVYQPKNGFTASRSSNSNT